MTDLNHWSSDPDHTPAAPWCPSDAYMAMLNEALTKDLVPADCYDYECFHGGPVLSREELVELGVGAPWA